MQRRRFLSLGACALPASLLTSSLLPVQANASPRAASPHDAADGWHTFELTTQVDLPASAAGGGPARVWLPVATSPGGGYQQALGTRWEAPGAKAELRMVRGAAGVGVPMLAVAWPDATQARTVTLVNTFATRDRRVDLSQPPSADAPKEAPAVLRQYLQPTTLQPTDGLVRETAEKITRGQQGDVEKARAIYEWIVDNCRREGSVRGCGTGDVRYMLTTGNLAVGAEIGSNYTLEVFAQNLWDERGEILRFQACGTCGDRPYIVPIQPRTIGIRAGAKF